MALLLDTSVLVRRINPASVQHPLAVQALRRLTGRGESCYLVPQNIVAFWAVATRPHSANGLGLSPSEAEAERVSLESLFTLLPDSQDLYARWVQLVNQFGVSGKPTHDARLAAAILEHGVTHLLTFNISDFQRYTSIGIIAVDPATV